MPLSDDVRSEQAYGPTHADSDFVVDPFVWFKNLPISNGIDREYLSLCNMACLWGQVPATGSGCAVSQHLGAPHIGLGSPTLSPYCLVGGERALTCAS